MSIIKDGAGSGYTARVSSENRLHVTSVSVPSDQHVNEDHQKYFSVPFSGIDPVGADDYFFYIENTGIKNLHVTDFRMRSTVAGNVGIHHVIGTPVYVGETAVTPVNRYLGQTGTLDATVNTDTDITGLTNQGELFCICIPVINTTYHLKTSSHIIIPPGQAMALHWDTATGAISGTVSIYEAQQDV